MRVLQHMIVDSMVRGRKIHTASLRRVSDSALLQIFGDAGEGIFPAPVCPGAVAATAVWSAENWRGGEIETALLLDLPGEESEAPGHCCHVGLGSGEF